MKTVDTSPLDRWLEDKNTCVLLLKPDASLVKKAVGGERADDVRRGHLHDVQCVADQLRRAAVVQAPAQCSVVALPCCCSCLVDNSVVLIKIRLETVSIK